MKKRIKIFVMDVDGTMTNGKIYMGKTGEIFKAFDIKDGYGIHEILPAHNVTTVILTGRFSDIVINRGKELAVDHILQNIKDKKNAIKELAKTLGCDTDEIAYIGDDIIDLDAMELCGAKGCPADAVTEIKAAADYVSCKKGGEGAVRDFIEWLLAVGMI
ncbi:MAG: HAD hydrolase family protein [Lachnospiraceae bacterium]|jgi:3-deoxy-D-manno-octulosonate 8-phosphate phosphatase (KDO 8-P phosphatase)|uniref:KdsC family phosphatase n=1 Tax=Roseburia sp. 1XD42-69 TaxID=2320088 RepID=UPI000EA3FB0B|nr:HAD hydrolase family protein [Roseburia sp. 1XD42-69]MCI8875922.1 HAD hydrolase family protein [Lachnospiraceae bacterium]RKJ66358.1 3-deoxy-D-manno-octulosonate 8-phosphate phosphatase [Roseburia sp. 1XD42-69]